MAKNGFSVINGHQENTWTCTRIWQKICYTVYTVCQQLGTKPRILYKLDAIVLYDVHLEHHLTN